MTIIEVPNMNDSVCSVNLGGELYKLRFTYNVKYDYWSFGVRNANNDIIAEMIKIVPDYPLTYNIVNPKLPKGDFGCISDEANIGRYDFKNGLAQFVFIPEGEK